MTTPETSHAVERLGELLSRETGQILAEGRQWRIETSLRPLLRSRGFASLSDLLRALDRDADDALKAEAVDAMLNHESSFFRDLAVFRTIEDKVLPQLTNRLDGRTLRIWCAGCSTGQEVYSLAMIVKRSKALAGRHVVIQGSDVSGPVIEKARRGRYAQMDMQRGLPISELLRWFQPVGNDWQIVDEIRDMVSFHTDNLLDPRQITGSFDLVLCRNVLFYFPEALRREACDQIARRCRPGALVVLGAGEVLGNHAAFSPSPELSGIYVAGRPTGEANIAALAFPAMLPPAAPLG